MPAYPFSRRSAAFSICAALACTALRAAPITVTDDKGRSIEIELVSLADNSVTFRRQGNPKEFTLPISQFAEPSQQLIRKQASQLPVAPPKIQPEVVIGKRRKLGDSYYMVKQEITCTLKLSNTGLTARVPTLAGKIVFIGQNQRTPELLYILSAQSVEATIKPGTTFIKDMEPFMTSYDSDNKGAGNIGGYQYFGYILVLADEAGNVVLDQTTTGSLRLALNNKPSLLKDVLKFQQGKLLTSKLEPSPVAGGVFIPR